MFIKLDFLRMNSYNLIVRDNGAADLYRKIGSLIAQAREKHNGGKLTQAVLANRVNLSRASIVNIERGRHRVSLYLLYRIAAELGVPPTEFLPPSTIDSNNPGASLPPEVSVKLRSSFERENIARVLGGLLKEGSDYESKGHQRKSRKSFKARKDK